MFCMIFRRFLKLILLSVESFAAFLFFYLTIALVGGSMTTGTLKKDGEILIYVASNGIHTDVCIPSKTVKCDWSEFISTQPYKTTDTSYIKIGWGDKGFFLDTPEWSDLTVSTALTAVFLPSSTAMHVAYIEQPKTSEICKKVSIDSKEYIRLIDFIKSSFEKKKNMIQLIAGKGYSNNDNFYEANNSYHLFRTCNSWTNEALKIAGVKTGVYALFPHGILSHLP